MQDELLLAAPKGTERSPLRFGYGLCCSSARFLEAGHSSRFFMAHPLYGYGTSQAPSRLGDASKHSRFIVLPHTYTHTEFKTVLRAAMADER